MPINNKKLRHALRFVFFSLGLILMLTGIHRVTIRKTSDAKLHAFYEECKTIDVLFTGISHMEVAYSPLELYQDFGITSFNFGESGNQLPTSYWVIENALDYCDPKLVVIDVRKIEDNEIAYDNLTTTSFDSIPLSKTKIRTAIDLFDNTDDRMEFLIPLLRYHSRWTELTENDFAPDDFRIDMGTLHYPDNRLAVAVPKSWGRLSTDKREVTGSLSEEYLRKLITLCKEKDIQVLLLNLPYPADKQSQLYANGVITIAEEMDVPYLDLLHAGDDFFNYDTDMNDSYGHINDSGAQKVTRYLGQYFTDHFDLPDHRGDSRYASWDERLEQFKEYQLSRLDTQTKLDTYLMLLSNDEFGKFIYIREGSPILEDHRMQQLIQNMAGTHPLEVLFEAALENTSYCLLVDSEEGGVWEGKGLEKGEAGFEADTNAFGHVIVSADSDGNPVLYIEGSEDNLLSGMKEDVTGLASADFTSRILTSSYRVNKVKETVLTASKK